MAIKKAPKKAHAFRLVPGVNVLIRTAKYDDLGTIERIDHDLGITLVGGGYLADGSRFSEMLTTGKVAEFEPAPWQFVPWGAIIDVQPWAGPMPAGPLG